MERILAAVAPVRERCTIISFDADAVRHARAAGGMRIGWVLDGDPGQLRPVLELMQPEYVFCNHTRLAAGRPLPAGPWTWVIYEVTDADHARCGRRGLATALPDGDLTLLRTCLMPGRCRARPRRRSTRRRRGSAVVHQAVPAQRIGDGHAPLGPVARLDDVVVSAERIAKLGVVDEVRIGAEP